MTVDISCSISHKNRKFNLYFEIFLHFLVWQHVICRHNEWLLGEVGNWPFLVLLGAFQLWNSPKARTDAHMEKFNHWNGESHAFSVHLIRKTYKEFDGWAHLQRLFGWTQAYLKKLRDYQNILDAKLSIQSIGLRGYNVGSHKMTDFLTKIHHGSYY